MRWLRQPVNLRKKNRAQGHSHDERKNLGRGQEEREMVDPLQLEKMILMAISGVGPSEWVRFSMGGLRNRLADLDRSLGMPSDGEITDCIYSLHGRSLIHVRKYDTAGYVSLVRSISEPYTAQFFGIGSFELKLNHEGRKKMIDRAEVEVASSADAMDDRLPLFRRKVFDADLESAEKELHGSGLGFALVMIDIDKFKQVNDVHGHPTGDEVLMGVAAAISSRVAVKGKAYRYGGEEMAILLANYSRMEATTLAEMIRIDLERSQMSEKRLKVTASFGVAAAPEDARTGQEILALADAALLSAKKLGRNLVRAVGDSDKVTESRAPERKQPVPQGLSDEEQNAIRMTHFRGRTPECPKDGALLRVHEFQDMGSKTPTLLVSCPSCGMQEFLAGA
jgi:diguanylate cyclase (GGDEF)-like protein